jgi:tetratricopeptide (TPR) repeat protein
VYVFILMITIVIWAIFRIAQTAQTIFLGFKKSWDTAFDNRMSKYLDIGNYNEVISACEEVLEKYPFHSDATWYLARAYFGLNKQPEAIKYFKKAVELVPSWKDSANEYIEILNERLSINYNK